MVRDADATRRRIIEAAEAEFAAYGIAGARVDRVAEAASANKAMIYKYFGTKEELFDAVFAKCVLAFVDEAEFDATDLPAYAGRVFDLYERYPNMLRLATWYQLERAEGKLPAIVESNNAKLTKIEEAQKAGLLTTTYSPLELLTEVRALSMSWQMHTPELALVRRPSRSRCREIVIESVQRLLNGG